MATQSRIRHAGLALLMILCAMTLSVSAQETAVEPKSDESVPPARTEYMGRQIALTMSYHGAPWLIRKERELEERCSLMLANLGLEQGMTVCDMGCGNGFYALQIAKIVGSTGRVLGVDIQPEMLRLLKRRASARRVRNIEPVLGTVADPNLPSGEVDLILCVDVYHEFSHPERMLQAMRESLSEKGVVVLLEYRAEDPDVPIKPLHKMSKAQIMKELPANGFKLVKEFDGLPWQHMMFFGRDGEDDESPHDE
jgi:2-polyprenyl-3-methyl-5-hydroxy-6-metoxy-1,4-benzoquinol methylase